jgi:hypothetical protein
LLASAVLGSLLLLAAPAAAQICGDADDDGEVNVADGVQALRAAADLSSLCGAACDLDASGDITVIDGVNILRKAADLSVVDGCDFTGEETNEVVNPALGFFDGLVKVPGIGGGSALVAGTPECDNDEGVAEIVDTPNTSAATFDNCMIGAVILDGTISRATLGQGVAVGFDGYRITRVANGRSFTYDGTLALSNEQLLGRRLNGTLQVTSSELGDLGVQFERILIVANGSARDGFLRYDLTDTTKGRIDRIQIEFTTGNELPVRVQLRNGTIRDFILDRRTRTVGLPL